MSALLDAIEGYALALLLAAAVIAATAVMEARRARRSRKDHAR